jgi:hypothetical protein
MSELPNGEANMLPRLPNGGKPGSESLVKVSPEKNQPEDIG